MTSTEVYVPNSSTSTATSRHQVSKVLICLISILLWFKSTCHYKGTHNSTLLESTNCQKNLIEFVKLKRSKNGLRLYQVSASR